MYENCNNNIVFFLKVTGRESLIHFISYILNNYKTNTTIRKLIDNTDIHILVAMNPDGYQVAYDTFDRQEGNCTGVIGRCDILVFLDKAQNNTEFASL